MIRLFQKILAKWLEQAARNLELTDKVIPSIISTEKTFHILPVAYNITYNGLCYSLKANWPENGLQLAEVFFTAEKPDELMLMSCWHWISLVWYRK